MDYVFYGCLNRINIFLISEEKINESEDIRMSKSLPYGVYVAGGIFFVPLRTEFIAKNKVFYRDIVDGDREYLLDNFTQGDMEKAVNLPFDAKVYIRASEVVTTCMYFAIIWANEGQKCFEAED